MLCNFKMIHHLPRWNVLEIKKFNPNEVSMYPYMMISYPLSSESPAWHYHIMIFVALNSGRQKYTLKFWRVVRLPDCILHQITEYFVFLSFNVSILIKMMGPNPLYNNTRKLLYPNLTLCVIIHQCGIAK